MFETLAVVITAMSNALYTASNSSIAAVCGWAWSNLLGGVAGIVVGGAILRSFFDDDLADLFRQTIAVSVPLALIVFLIKPGSENGCRVVNIKNDVLAIRAQITSLVAPEFAGGPSDLIGKSTKKMQKLLDDFNKKVAGSILQDPGKASDKVPPPTHKPLPMPVVTPISK